jgi:hypothetical protein
MSCTSPAFFLPPPNAKSVCHTHRGTAIRVNRLRGAPCLLITDCLQQLNRCIFGLVMSGVLDGGHTIVELLMAVSHNMILSRSWSTSTLSVSKCRSLVYAAYIK